MNGGNWICWELSRWVAVLRNYWEQQQRLIAFYLFYSTKPELRLMYKSNVTRQALMLHRLLHMWYFSHGVRMARWVSLGVEWTSFIDPKQGRNLPQPPTSLHHIHPSIQCLSPLVQHPGLLKPITAPMGRRLGAPWTSGLYVAEPRQRQTAALSYFHFHPAGAFLLACPVLPACHSCVPSSSNPHRHVLTSCVAVKDGLSGLLVCAALGTPPHNNHICNAFILSAASKLFQNV